MAAGKDESRARKGGSGWEISVIVLVGIVMFGVALAGHNWQSAQTTTAREQPKAMMAVRGGAAGGEGGATGVGGNAADSGGGRNGQPRGVGGQKTGMDAAREPALIKEQAEVLKEQAEVLKDLEALKQVAMNGLLSTVELGQVTRQILKLPPAADSADDAGGSPATAAGAKVAGIDGAGEVGGRGQAAAGLTPGTTAKYGFYLHAFNGYVSALIEQVERISEFFPGAPVYLMSDGGDRYDGVCNHYTRITALAGRPAKCTWVYCPPANDRWNPQPFLRRMYDAAVALDTEFLIMLEPDNSIHRSVVHAPDKDAGGVIDFNPKFSSLVTQHAEAHAHRLGKTGYKWEYTGSGLCGGSYFRTAAVLDAFSDEAVAAVDWVYYQQHDSKRIFSSDFAMPILLAMRGWTYGPWKECKQEEGHEMPEQPKEAAFHHYGRGFPGGKPMYNLKPRNWTDIALSSPPIPLFAKNKVTCQRCWNKAKYVETFGTDMCSGAKEQGYWADKTGWTGLDGKPLKPGGHTPA